MDNNKYKLLDVSLNAMEKGAFNLLVARGAPGMGKTYKVLDFVKKKKLDYAYIKTYSTPLKFYELLYKNKDKKVIIFDDLSNIGDVKILSMLKSACWSVHSDGREVNYHTTSKAFEKLNIPDNFEVRASIILIFNGMLDSFEPIANRGVNINFDFTFSEKLDIFNELEVDNEIDKDIIDYVRESCSEATKNLSIRSLVILSNVKEKGFDWKVFAKEMLSGDEDVQLLLDLTLKYPKLEEACNKWIVQTGKSRSTFMRIWRGIKKK